MRRLKEYGLIALFVGVMLVGIVVGMIAGVFGEDA